MADNFLYIPFLNPVKFFEVGKTNLDQYFTKHFDDYEFASRLYDWQVPEDYVQLWQTTDIINLQFESTFDPIVVDLLDSSGNSVTTLPALIGLPNKFYPNVFAFEIALSLADVDTGCYRLQLTAGSGDGQKVYLSNRMYISAAKFAKSTLLIEYYHSRAHDDVMFESGIKFQYRVPGYIGYLKPGRVLEAYKDQKQNPSVLSSRNTRGWPVYFGDQYGLPDDAIDLLNRIWGCDSVSIDGKSFAAIESELEFFEVDGENIEYPKRGVKLQIEEGINRNSSIFAVETDTSKKLAYGIVVEAKVWGDTSNQGSANTVPIITVE